MMNYVVAPRDKMFPAQPDYYNCSESFDVLKKAIRCLQLAQSDDILLWEYVKGGHYYTGGRFLAVGTYREVLAWDAILSGANA